MPRSSTGSQLIEHSAIPKVLAQPDFDAWWVYDWSMFSDLNGPVAIDTCWSDIVRGIRSIDDDGRDGDGVNAGRMGVVKSSSLA